jgi:hypothetical protein
VTGAEQLENGLQRLQPVERQHSDLHRRHEFAPLHPVRRLEQNAERRIEIDRLHVEQPGHEI